MSGINAADEFNVAVIGSTRGSSMGSLEELDSLLGRKMVSLVVSNKSKEEAGILQRAEVAGVPAYHIPGASKAKNRTKQDFEQELNALLTEHKIDLIVMVGFMVILTEKFIHKWEGKILNVHPSLLPLHAGGMDLNVHKEVIEAHEKKSGCTVHFATEVADAGPQVVQSECDVIDGDTEDTLKARVQALEKQALVQAVELFNENRNLYNTILNTVPEGKALYLNDLNGRTKKHMSKDLNTVLHRKSPLVTEAQKVNEEEVLNLDWLFDSETKNQAKNEEAAGVSLRHNLI